MKRKTVVYYVCNSAFQMLKTQVFALTGAFLCEWFWRWPWERQMKQSFCSPNRLSFRRPQHGKPARVELPWGRTQRGARVLPLQMSRRCAELVCRFKNNRQIQMRSWPLQQKTRWHVWRPNTACVEAVHTPPGLEIYCHNISGGISWKPACMWRALPWMSNHVEITSSARKFEASHAFFYERLEAQVEFGIQLLWMACSGHSGYGWHMFLSD